jgi:hypothetical protein
MPIFRAVRLKFIDISAIKLSCLRAQLRAKTEDLLWKTMDLWFGIP